MQLDQIFFFFKAKPHLIFLKEINMEIKLTCDKINCKPVKFHANSANAHKGLS